MNREFIEPPADYVERSIGRPIVNKENWELNFLMMKCLETWNDSFCPIVGTNRNGDIRANDNGVEC
jgi:hypothetical protein